MLNMKNVYHYINLESSSAECHSFLVRSHLLMTVLHARNQHFLPDYFLFLFSNPPLLPPPSVFLCPSLCPNYLSISPVCLSFSLSIAKQYFSLLFVSHSPFVGLFLPFVCCCSVFLFIRLITKLRA